MVILKIYAWNLLCLDLHPKQINAEQEKQLNMCSRCVFHILIIKSDTWSEVKFSSVQLLSQMPGGNKYHLLWCSTCKRWQFQTESLEHHLRSSLQVFVSHVRLRNQIILTQVLNFKAPNAHTHSKTLTVLFKPLQVCKQASRVHISVSHYYHASLHETDSKLYPSIS